MKCCILIPARNESAAVANVVTPLVARGLDVLVIDDGSTDQTAQAARAAGARVISRTGTHGKGAALREGLAWVTQHRYDAVVIVDADGQHVTEDVLRFVALAGSTDAALVIGNRMEHPKKMPFVRRSTNGFMSTVLSFVARQRVPDSQCGLRLIRCDVLRWCRLQADHFEIESELVLEVARLRGRIDALPIQSVYRAQRSQINPLTDTCRFFRFLWQRAWS